MTDEVAGTVENRQVDRFSFFGNSMVSVLSCEVSRGQLRLSGRAVRHAASTGKRSIYILITNSLLRRSGNTFQGRGPLCPEGDKEFIWLFSDALWSPIASAAQVGQEDGEP